MTIEEILRSCPKLSNEKTEDYVQHTNPDGEKGGWRHITARIGKRVSIGIGSVVIKDAVVGDCCSVGTYSRMGNGSRMATSPRWATAPRWATSPRWAMAARWVTTHRWATAQK